MAEMAQGPQCVGVPSRLVDEGTYVCPCTCMVLFFLDHRAALRALVGVLTVCDSILDSRHGRGHAPSEHKVPPTLWFTTTAASEF